MSELHMKTLSEMAGLLQGKEVTVTEAVNDCLSRIEATEPEVRALITIMGDSARSQAEVMDAAGPDADKPLWGVPIVLKDLLATKGTKTTCASRILENFVPFYDGTAVARLREAGAVIIGKANMDEFAMGSSTENSAFFQTRNPWDTGRFVRRLRGHGGGWPVLCRAGHGHWWVNPYPGVFLRNCGAQANLWQSFPFRVDRLRLFS